MPASDWDSAGWTSWIQDRLRRREWKPADLARALDVPNGTVSRWINGTRQPSSDSARRIADVFNVHPDAVLTLAGHRPSLDDDLDPNDPSTDLIVLVRRVVWDADREAAARALLEAWIKRGRKKG